MLGTPHITMPSKKKTRTNLVVAPSDQKAHMFNTLILTIAMAASSEATAQVPPIVEGKPIVRALRASSPIDVDGKLEEADWQRAEAFVTFTQRDPDEGKAATEATDVRVLYDDDSIYVGALMNDTQPKAIRALLGRRDSFLTTDSFTVYLDSYNDKRSGFYFGISAAGALSDGTLFNDDWDDSSWDGIWEGRATRTETGWSAELRIPLSQLRFKQEADARWGVNFMRTITRTNESVFASLRPKKDSGFVSRFLPLVGLKGLQPKKRWLATPYTTAKTRSAASVSGDPFNDGRISQGAFGADMKVGLGSNLTLDVTINPDFGQVEVDPAVVNLSDVESFFGEKRPFFIEGSSTFDFGYLGASNNMNFNFSNPNLFYSRRIGRSPQGSVGESDYSRSPEGVRIDGAAKLTGKVAEHWNMGVLQAFTGEARADVALGARRFQEEVEPRTSYSVVRAHRDFSGGRRGIGFIGTFVNRSLGGSRLADSLNGRAMAFGVDGWTSFGKGKGGERIWALTGRFATTRVEGSATRLTALQRNSAHYFQRPDATHVEVDPQARSLSGYSFRLALNREKGPATLNAAVGAVSPGLDANDLGITFRTDQINGHIAAGYRWPNGGWKFRNGGFQGGVFRTNDFGGNMTSLGYFTWYWARFKNYWGFNGSVFVNPETTSVTRTRGGVRMLSPSAWSWDFGINSDDRKSLTFNAGTRGSYGANESNYERGVYVSVDWKPAPNVSLSVSPDYSYEKNGAQFVRNISDPTAVTTFGTRHVFARLIQRTFSAGIRANWTFSPALSLQTYFQPLISSGAYADFGSLARPLSYEFTRYPAGTRPSGVSNPDFTFKSIRGNAVLRYEFKPGSAAYFVWTQNRSDSDSIGEFRLRKSFSSLLDSPAENIFLLKVAFGWGS